MLRKFFPSERQLPRCTWDALVAGLIPSHPSGPSVSLTWHGIRSLIILAPEQNMMSQLAQYGDTGVTTRMFVLAVTLQAVWTLLPPGDSWPAFGSPDSLHFQESQKK